MFIALRKNRHTIDTGKSVGGWLFVVSHNKALSVLKKRIRELVVVTWQPNVPDAPATDDRHDEKLYGLQMALMEEAVEPLPARKRDVFRRCRFDGQSSEEVAHQIGIPTASVDDQLKQSTHFIRNYIRTRPTPSQLAVLVGLPCWLG